MKPTVTYPLPAPRSDWGRYRYFFNGQESDGEVYGTGSLHAFEYRMHDTRIGRFWSVDPLAGKFPWNSTYAFAENRVVDGRELEGLEWNPNKPLHTTEEDVAIRVVSASDNIKVVPNIRPKNELRLQMNTKTMYLTDPGEIRPAPSIYEKEWRFHAAYFENSLRSDLVIRSISTGGFFVTSFLFGGYVASDVMPYAMKSGEGLYSVGLKMYNNPLGKRVIGAGLGYVGYKQKWSPDVTFSDPTIGAYSLLFQFLFDTWDKNKSLFDEKLKFGADTFLQNRNNDAKPNHTQSTEKKD
jgi:RHS repeat-associated protein